MYSLIVRDYSIADIEAFSALSIRRGSTIASLAKASSDNLRIVTGAWLLFLPKAADEAAVRASAERFLAGPGAWMNETPEGLVAAALESGLLEKTFEGFANGLAPRPNVTAARLTDELETAAAILAARRARTREALQAKNRAVNSGEPPVDDEADRRFMTEALAEARAAAQAGEVPVGAVVARNGEIIAAIALAVKLNKAEMHDRESDVITINKVARVYSPWSSKIHGMTPMPERIRK